MIMKNDDNLAKTKIIKGLGDCHEAKNYWNNQQNKNQK